MLSAIILSHCADCHYTNMNVTNTPLMLKTTYMPFMPSVLMQNVVMLNVVAPVDTQNYVLF